MSGMEDSSQLSPSTTEDPERRDFFQRLYSLHEQLGTPVRRQPMVSGRLVDLFDFHKYVQGQGGYKKITESRKWTYTARTLYPDLTYNHMLRAGYLLRNYYLKLLQPYDDSYGPEAELKKQIHSSFNSPLALRRNSLLSPLPLSLKAPSFTPVTTTQSQSLPGSWKKVEPEPTGLPLDKLLRSLESGYPNEVDFAMNTLVIISDQDDIAIDKHPKLLELLTAHVGIPSSDSKLCELYQSWYEDRPVGVDHAAFWREMVPCIGNLRTPCYESSLTPSSFFHSKFRMGSRLCNETYRVTQVLTILLNLSFQQELVPFLVGNAEVLRLLALASNSFSPELSTLAADALGNLAKEVVLNHEERYELSVQLIDTVHFMITSQDHHKIVRGLEILEGLAEKDSNVPFLVDLPVNTLQVIFNALLLGDLQLLCASLDCLIGLSDHSDLCVLLLRVNRAVDILLSLLTFESTALDVTSLEELAVYQPANASPAKAGGVTGTSQTSPIIPGPAHSGASTVTQPLQVGGTVKRGGGVLPSPLATNSVAAPKTSQNPLLLNSDLIAKAWLQACYEETLGEKSSWSEMCMLYNAYCAKLSNIGAMSSTEFLTVLRAVYPMAVLTKLVVGKDVLVMVVGLRKRNPLSNPILLLSQEAAKTATKWTTPLHHSSAQPSHLRPSSPTIASAALPISLIPSPLFSPLAKQSTTTAATSTAAPTAMTTTVSTPPSQPVAVSTPRLHLNTALTPLARSFQAKPTFVNIANYAQRKDTGRASTRVIPPVTSSRDQKLDGCGQSKGEGVSGRGSSTPKDSGEGDCGGKPSSQLHDVEGSCKARSGSASPCAGCEGVDGNTFQRAAQSTAPSGAITPSASPHVYIAVKAQGNAAGKGATSNDSPVRREPTSNHNVISGENQQLHSGKSLPSKMSASYEHSDGPPLLMNGSATESEVAKFRGLSSTPLILRKRARDGVLNVGGASIEGGACAKAKDEPPPKLPRCNLEANSPLPLEPIGEQEVESEAGEVSDEDMLVTGKEGDTSEEEEIELVVDENQKDMREFLQSEEGTKWLRDNPDKKVCKWGECYSVHVSLERHIFLEHGSGGGGTTCKWAGCLDQTIRQGPSLMMHLRECHLCCSEEAGCRGKGGAPSIQQVLARLREMDPFQMPDEDVLTKSIRFSAALVLRNLSRNCLEARSLLQGYESRLVETALSESDASTIIANCLHFIAQDNLS